MWTQTALTETETNISIFSPALDCLQPSVKPPPLLIRIVPAAGFLDSYQLYGNAGADENQTDYLK